MSDTKNSLVEIRMRPDIGPFLLIPDRAALLFTIFATIVAMNVTGNTSVIHKMIEQL